jgi:hypothetical protein
LSDVLEMSQVSENGVCFPSEKEKVAGCRRRRRFYLNKTENKSSDMIFDQQIETVGSFTFSRATGFDMKWPNQALVATSMSVTLRACARIAPSIAAPHL